MACDRREQWPARTAGRAPDLEDDFSAPLSSDLWVDHYLPHWTTPDRSAARYDLTGTGLRLRIERDQLDWRAEDAPLRVSNLQTGTFSGKAGSRRGTHRYREDGLTVRTPTATKLLWVPSAGRVDITVSASRDPGCMLAAWLVGTEHLSERHAGEVCVFEIDAYAIRPGPEPDAASKPTGTPVWPPTCRRSMCPSTFRLPTRGQRSGDTVRR